MARKNAQKNDSSSITFNTRTKAVMADVVQDNIKEKVNAVREVVFGKSNNEIVLVLQYYDYNVEKAIQAYYEDGAKSALTEWHYSGTKQQTVKKKKNKKQKQQQAAAPKSPQSSSSDAGSTASLRVNGEATPADQGREPIMNGVVDHDMEVLKVSEPVKASTREGPNAAAAKTLKSSITQNGMVTEPVVPTVTPVTAASQKEKSKSVSPEPHPHQPLPQRSSHQSHGNRQRTHSGSHPHTGNRTRTASSTSVSSTGAGDSKPVAKKHIHAGLEKSVKDLHRQTVSLDRLRFVFEEEVERAYKRIKTVFDELRTCINSRESDLVRDMDKTRDMARDVFSMRLGVAADLKVKIDRAEKLKDTELAELRTDVKHFVSDRKIDEDLGRTTRFLYDSDHIVSEIKNFGEIVPAKCAYIPQHPSSPAVAMSHPVEEQKEETKKPTKADSSNTKPSSGVPEVEKVVHLGPAETHELAELQRRLKHSLNLEGIPVQTYPDRPASAPDSNTNSQPAPRQQRVRPESGSSRRNNRNRQRPRGDQERGDRPRETKEDQGPNRAAYPQGQKSGDRVVLIGKGARPQSSYRGGRGRGGYGGRGRGGSSSAPRNIELLQEAGSSKPVNTNSVKPQNPEGPQAPRSAGSGSNTGGPRNPRSTKSPGSPGKQSRGPRNSGSKPKAEGNSSQAPPTAAATATV